ncbi:hypothetical protein M513_13506 [Trichuris suis]|uniref:CCHC-type domain-containing protein n=1 Tax=Trichuris suis TaxID=68888 RepID=A0A085LKW8_9BILA|nr:hypothetical protein M513_13506 [Trichuris suis]
MTKTGRTRLTSQDLELHEELTDEDPRISVPMSSTSRTQSRRRGRLSQGGSHPDAVSDISQSAERDDSRGGGPETPASVKIPPEDDDRTSKLDDAAQLNRDRVVQDVSWFEELADSTSMTKATLFVPNPWMQQIASASQMDIFDGDTRKWPTFIANFRALVHGTIRSDAQRMAVLGQLLSPRLRSGFSGLLADPAMYREVSGPVSTMKLCGLVHDLHSSALLEHTTVLSEKMLMTGTMANSRATTAVKERKGHTAHTTTVSLTTKGKCCICTTAGHQTQMCPRFLSMNVLNRTEEVISHGLCLRCLGKGHRQSDCSQSQLCRKDGCQAYHHRLLHGAPRLVDVASRMRRGLTPTHQNVERVDVGLASRRTTRRTTCEISSLDGASRFQLKQALVVPQLQLGTRTMPVSMMKKQWNHLKNIRFPAAALDRVEMLISMDVPLAHHYREVKVGPNTQTCPIGVLTPFGWTIVGRVPKVLKGSDHLEEDR